MKVSLFWGAPRPWHLCEMCVLGLATLRDDDWFDIALCLYFFELGLHFERR